MTGDEMFINKELISEVNKMWLDDKLKRGHHKVSAFTLYTFKIVHINFKNYS